MIIIYFFFQHHIWYSLPNVIFGVFALIAIPVCFLLPETLGRAMPETLEDVIGDKRWTSNIEIEIEILYFINSHHDDAFRFRHTAGGSFFP